MGETARRIRRENTHTHSNCLLILNKTGVVKFRLSERTLQEEEEDEEILPLM